MAEAPYVPAEPRDTVRESNSLIKSFLHHLHFTQAEAWETATPYDHFTALALSVRDLMIDRMIATQTTYRQRDVKRAYYLSLEYLIGQQLEKNLACLGLYESCKRRLSRLGLDLDRLCDFEPDAGLGNGGLGRLAACYLDSAATLEYPLYGYGLRYEFGIFEQDIVDGWQVERPDYWLRLGSPWEIPRQEYACPVRIGGFVEEGVDRDGEYRPIWKGYRTLMGLPYDLPIMAHGSYTVNLLRLWSARAPETFDLAAFNRGGYVEAIQQAAITENITKVLYPSDETDAGRELRLTQQYFFVACSLSDIIRRYERNHDTLDALPEKVSVQLNDTHPALAIVELMRVLVDERGMPWDYAWELTRATFNYTNHTLLPEALEVWPVELFRRILPRHLQIIYELNQRFLDGEVERQYPQNAQKRASLSIIQESPSRSVRMANIAIVGSKRVNGVATLHTRLLRERVVPDFAELWPQKFLSVTNGVTPRRWMLVCNPLLSQAISKRIGDNWLTDLDELRQLEPLSEEAEFRREMRIIKRANKQRLADWIRSHLGLTVSPDALFDVHIKRLHEYKRQLLNILHVIIHYHRLLKDPDGDHVPRVVLFGAKAAPAYERAKLIIKLINDVARTINRDSRIGQRLRVVFLPNYRVSLAEKIIPATDLSEQISTAGMEASGTGNMKFAMNGALTIGTLDGANIEIRDAVGEENFFLFGMTAEQVAASHGSYNPWDIYNRNEEIKHALDAIAGGAFNPDRSMLHRPIFDSLTHDGDRYRLLADLEGYLEAQQRVAEMYRDPEAWSRAMVLNIARMGYFSSDRAVREYAEQIWGIERVPIKFEAGDDSRAPRKKAKRVRAEKKPAATD